jgi:hypothetical protein
MDSKKNENSNVDSLDSADGDRIGKPYFKS